MTRRSQHYPPELRERAVRMVHDAWHDPLPRLRWVDSPRGVDPTSWTNIGQSLLVKNDDNFLHNVHSLAIDNTPFNFGQPTKDDGKDVDPMKAAEYFRIKCDVHPWMSAYIGVFEHPFFAVTKEDGTYKIDAKGLPDGDYTLTFWHEKYATDPVEEKVTIKDGKAEANHTFKAEAAMAEPKVKTVILASDSGEEKCCEKCKLEKVAGK